VKRSVTAILFLFVINLSLVNAQGEIDDAEKIFYRNERTFAATLGSNGFAGNFRYAKRIDAFRKTTYEIGFAYIKHEKEYKISYSSSPQLGGSFVFGKTNSLFALRAGIGLQKELFRKEDKGGISIRYFFNFGPSIGFQKPVYYDVIVSELDSEGNYVQVRKTMKFESHITAVERKAPFYNGLDEISLVPGIYGKCGFTFEFGKNDQSFSAFETGIIFDAYLRKIPIMANDHNHWFYPAVFISYRFGKVIDAQFINRRTKIDEILTD
jgi:hypothetical protein